MLWEGNGSKREQMRRDIQRKISQINMERRELECRTIRMTRSSASA